MNEKNGMTTVPSTLKPMHTKCGRMESDGYKKRIQNYIQEHKREMTAALKELIKIPSVRESAEENAPFGSSIAHALAYVKRLYADNGFDTELDENGGFLLSYFGTGKRTIGLFAHADVVSTGEGWTQGSAFSPFVQDGFLFGRGATDDKSAIVASLYILKMCKELELPINNRLVCFTGGNEESGMQDIQNYLSSHVPPDFSLILDTAFPLYCGNKGIVRCVATSKLPLSNIMTFYGGQSFNISLGNATVVLPYGDCLYEALRVAGNGRIRVRAEDGKIILTAEGISCHSALPEGSVNAGALLAELLSDCSMLKDDDRKTMRFLSDILPDIYGNKLGIADCDDAFGQLTCTNGVIGTDNGKLSFSLDIRFGKNVQVEELQEKITKKLAENGFAVEFLRAVPAHITDQSNEYIQACLRTYREVTGDVAAQPYINAGGTYAMYLPCAAEIGTSLMGEMPKLPQGHGGVHQPDECLHLEGFFNAVEMTALMLLECDKIQERE